MHNITQTTLWERIKHSFVFAWASWVLIWITQIKESVNQILLSSCVDFGQTVCTSFINWSIYNYLKKILRDKTELENKNIIYTSIVLVSILWVWAPKYIIHKLAGTTNPEIISFFYVVGNIAVMYLYESKILQKKK
mgnify:CR=1 FL=1